MKRFIVTMLLVAVAIMMVPMTQTFAVGISGSLPANTEYRFKQIKHDYVTEFCVPGAVIAGNQGTEVVQNPQCNMEVNAGWFKCPETLSPFEKIVVPTYNAKGKIIGYSVFIYDTRNAGMVVIAVNVHKL